MKDRTRLLITGVVALGALAVTLGGHGVSFQFRDDRKRDHEEGRIAGVRSFADLRDFDGVTVAGPDDVVIAHGKEFSVKAEGDKEALEHLRFRIADGTLHVGRDSKSSWSKSGGDSATIRIVLPAIQRVTLTGPGEMQVDKLDGRQVEAKVTGPGDLTIGTLAAEEAKFSLTGPGDLTASGTATAASLSATGSGNIQAAKLATRRASLRLIGSGNISVHATQGADIAITGSGDAHVTGTTACEVTAIGPGGAECKS